MKIFELMKKHNQEQIAFYTDKSVKLRAILALHNTTLGPAIGGIRILKYDTVSNALFDLYRLSRAMTLKVAAGGLNFGGGYAVVIKQEGMKKNEALFRSMGRFIESFQGRFIAGGEMGVTEESMEYLRMETRYICGLPAYFGGSGNHSDMCAYGTFRGIMAAAKYKWGTDNLEGKKFIIQGYGKTGTRIADHAVKRNAHVIVTDIDDSRLALAKEKGLETIPADKVYDEKCDIFVPCAIGNIVSSDTVDRFKCDVIAGPANNQLLNDDDDKLLKKKGILFAPDFIINVGGIVDVSDEYLGYCKDRVIRRTEGIYDRLLEVLQIADNQDMSYNESAINYALQRIESIKKIKSRSLMEEKCRLA